MSFDELPPGEKRRTEPAASPEQEPSSSDAPPAPRTRRRPTRAGTAAASSTEAIEPTSPTPPSRSRRRSQAVSADAADLQPPASPEVAPARVSRKRASTPSAEPGAASLPEPDAQPPARARSRRSRPTQPDDQAAAAPEPQAVELAEAGSEAAPRRRRRSKSLTAPAEAATAAQAPPPEAGQPGAAPAPRQRRVRRAPAAESIPAAAPAAEAAEEEKPARAKRRRARPADASEPRAGEPAVEAAEPEETDAGLEGGEEPERKRRRSRRSGRGHRSKRAGAEVAVEGAPEEEPVDISVGAHLVALAGRPTIHIDGSPYPPILFFGNLEGGHASVLAEVKRAAAAGVHLHSALIELTCPLSEASDALDQVDERLRAILDADPEGRVMPRIVCVPAPGWRREYPTEISVYADGSYGDPSITSQRYWAECERSLEALIRHIQEQVWGPRVFAYHLERGEWFQPVDLGPDRSVANRDAFRDWLRARYQDDLVKLRAAWYDGDVQFHTAEIPPVHTPDPQRAFFDTRRERRFVDFNEFTSESTVSRILSLAGSVKRATRRNALVSVCYGYTFEFAHGFSGHLDLGRLLDSRDVDLICGPPSYRDRTPGGAGSFPGPVDSISLHGKLWISEDDTKTHLAPVDQDPDDFNPRLNDRRETDAAHIRTLGRALAHGAGVSWMDLWGEGWLNDDTIWDRIKRFRGLSSLASARRGAPQVVALIDEKSLLHVQRGEEFFRRVTSGLRDSLQRAGLEFGTYLQSDLLHASFPTGARLYIFLNAYRLPAAHRQAILDKLHHNSTLLWLYAPGSCEGTPGEGALLEEAATDLLGITLRQLPWNSEIGSRVVDSNHPVTEKLTSKELGARERVNPSFSLDDQHATVLGEYQASGLPSVGVRNLGSWRSVFVGEVVLPVELLRGICHYAGAHVWSAGGEDLVDSGDGWLLVHSAREAHRQIRLPAAAEVYEVLQRRLIATGSREFRITLHGPETHLFYVGDREDAARLGLLPGGEPSRQGAPLHAGGEPAGQEPLISAAAPDPEPQAAQDGRNEDLETLRAVLSMEVPSGELAMEDVDEVAPAQNIGPADASAILQGVLTGEPASNGRRRRRRGGRGRGRRRAGAAGSAPAAGEGSQPGG